MVAFLVLLVILVNAVALFVVVIVAFVALVLRLEAALLLVLGLGAEASLRLTHLVELFAADVVVVLEDLVLLIACVLVLKLLDDGIGLLLALRILQVVHVELILQVVNVGVLLNVDLVEAFQLLLKALVLLLVFGLDILDAFQALLCTLELLLTPLDLVFEFHFVLMELLHSFLHFAHFPLLGVDDITNALFDVLLLTVGVQVA